VSYQRYSRFYNCQRNIEKTLHFLNYTNEDGLETSYFFVELFIMHEEYLITETELKWYN